MGIKTKELSLGQILDAFFPTLEWLEFLVALPPTE